MSQLNFTEISLEPKLSTIPRLLGICVALFLSTFLACSGYSVTGGPAPVFKSPFQATAHQSFNPLRLNVVAVLPLQDEQGSAGLGTYGQNPAEVTESLIHSLNLNTDLLVMNTSAPALVEKAMRSLKSAPLRSRAKQFAKALEAQAILYGVYRSGGSGKAQEDTGVSFSLWLLDISTDTIVWTGTFDKKNTPLSDNLFGAGEALKHGIRYRTSTELFKEGFDQASQSIQGYRTSQS